MPDWKELTGIHGGRAIVNRDLITEMVPFTATQRDKNPYMKEARSMVFFLGHVDPDGNPIPSYYQETIHQIITDEGITGKGRT